MTPKEKAHELLYKFMAKRVSWKQSKQCALIAVDEIIKCAIWKYNSVEHTHFWKEVKQELENL